jgi:hypothetical protein
MTKTALTITLASLLLGGCAEMSGLWLFEFATPTADNEECTETVDHNFSGATVKSDDGTGAHTITRTNEYSSSLAFVRFQDNGDGTGTLVVGNAVYPGVENENGSWSFEWMGYEYSSETEAFEEDYLFQQDVDSELTETFVVTFEGATASATITEHALDDRAYTETDQWSKMVMKTVGDMGRIPAGTYLEVDDKGRMVNASNEWDISDCSDADCSLTISSDCTGSWTATGTLTTFGTEEYDAVQNAGQQPGV